MENLKAFAREAWLFLSSTIFLVNFAKMVGVVIGIIILTNWWLSCFTSHGESVQVNDFTGMHILDAKKQGRDKGFSFIAIDSSWMEGKPGGIILSQSPKPLSRVKEGRKIYVTITQSVAEMIRLPLLSDSSYDYENYEKKLDRSPRNIKCRVKERVFDSKQANNTILYLVYNGKQVTERDIKDGFEVPRGSTVEFVITERRSNEMEIPDLLCMNYGAAEFLVSSSNLNIGEVIEDETVTDRSTAFVYKQEPPFVTGQTIRMGMQISVWLTQNKPDDCGGSTNQDGQQNDF